MHDENYFEIRYHGMTAGVTLQRTDHREYYRIEWPDDVIDILYLDNTHPDLPWASDTIDDPAKVADLGELIQING